MNASCLIYNNAIWGLYDACIEIGERRTFLKGHREVFVDPCKEVFEQVDYGVGTQEVICGASKYQDTFGGSGIKGKGSMVYDTIDKT